MSTFVSRREGDQRGGEGEREGTSVRPGLLYSLFLQSVCVHTCIRVPSYLERVCYLLLTPVFMISSASRRARILQDKNHIGGRMAKGNSFLRFVDELNIYSNTF